MREDWMSGMEVGSWLWDSPAYRQLGVDASWQQRTQHADMHKKKYIHLILTPEAQGSLKLSHLEWFQFINGVGASLGWQRPGR